MARPGRVASGGVTSTVPQTRRPSALDLLGAAVAAVPGGASRPGQVRMAEAVDEAISTGEHLLVQAGTGTGKSLAYLVGALREKGPVVVSTATLALQAQLIEHDLPRLAEAVTPLLGRPPTFAVLKGRHHYACRARLDAGAEEPEPDLFGESGGGSQWLGAAGRIGKQVVRLREWAADSETGDRDELDPGVDDMVWRTVSMPARECVGAQRCPFGDECFAEASRVRARSADIVVTNHSLLAVDMMSGRHILPPHEVLIIDEAHELADRMTSAARAELSAEAIDRATRRARTLLDGGVLDRLTEASDALALALAGAPPGRLVELPAAVRDAVSLVQAAGRAAVNAFGDVRADDPDPVHKQQAKSTVQTIAEVAERLLDCSPQDVIWVEGVTQEHPGLHVAPLSVAGLLRSLLYADRTVVATSATLALGGRFDTVAAGLGLPAGYGRTPETNDVRPDPPADGAAAPALRPTRSTQPFLLAGGEDDGDGEPPAWRALDVGSPFDYAKQGILYVAARLPRPTQSGLSDPAADELVRLVEALGGRTLGLFSSRRAADRAAEVVRAATGVEVYLQGDEALPILVRKFRQEQSSCLFGVMSLWQGVDVPGDSCQLVVIDRLPFPRPDEPLSAARSAAVDASGGSGFAAVSVPAAAVRLAQGVGRLVRADTDRGVVAVLDSRLHTARSYGTFLRNSLPPFWYTTSPDVVLGALRRLRDTAAAT
jgi:ATP-dependent DNA helicase DinG